jgi:antitoxin VapB
VVTAQADTGQSLEIQLSVLYIHLCIYKGSTMATARVFKSGNSQAVRLPKEFRFESKEVDIFRRGDEVVLREKSRGLERAFWLLANLPIDVDAIEETRKEPPQEREGL